jgi:hypothetical protein
MALSKETSLDKDCEMTPIQKLFVFSDFVFEQLNRESGLFGLTGSADSRDVEESALNENLKGSS